MTCAINHNLKKLWMVYQFQCLTSYTDPAKTGMSLSKKRTGDRWTHLLQNQTSYAKLQQLAKQCFKLQLFYFRR